MGCRSGRGPPRLIRCCSSRVIPTPTPCSHENPLALLIGMVLDQQIPLERAFRSPFDLQQRLGEPLDASLAGFDGPRGPWPTCSGRGRPSTGFRSRWPGGCRTCADRRRRHTAATPPPSGHRPPTATSCWPTSRRSPVSASRRPGSSSHCWASSWACARRAGRRRRPRSATQGSFRSVADIDSPEALAKVRQYKQKMKAQAKAKASQGTRSPLTGAARDRTHRSGRRPARRSSPRCSARWRWRRSWRRPAGPPVGTTRRR